MTIENRRINLDIKMKNTFDLPILICPIFATSLNEKIKEVLYL